MALFHQVFYPTAALKPYILFYSYIEMPAGTTCNVIPCTSFVMGLYTNGFRTSIQETAFKPLRYELFGLADVPRVFHSPDATRILTIHFNNMSSHAFLSVPLMELFNSEVSLDNFYKTSILSELEEQFLETDDPKAAVAIIEKFLIRQLKPVTPDPHIAGALGYIRASKGRIGMTQLADKLHCSQSLLEKKFRKALGTSPKKFASLVRFNTVIYNHTPGLSLTAKAHDAGYFDQAHFIRDFKAYAGRSPKRFFDNMETLGDFRAFNVSAL